MADQQDHRLTLLRHGQSIGNRDRVRQGQREFPLTDHGHAQVHALLSYWLDKGRKFDLIISSPLKRALDSAEILSQGLDVTIEQDPAWVERHGGVAEGQALEDKAQYLDRYLRASVYEPLFEGGETITDLHLRGLGAIQSVLNRPPALYLIVAHGGILNAAVRSILGLAPSGPPPAISFHFNNTGFMDLSFSRDSRTWRIHRSNVCAHLERIDLE